jgi:hypothetical protein
MAEPFGVSLRDVAYLTREQAIYLYHHARDEDGRLTPYGPPASACVPPAYSDRREFYEHYRFLGFQRWVIDRLWAERPALTEGNGRGG